MTGYAAVAQRTLATIRKAGGRVTFTTVSPRTYNGDTGVVTGGDPISAAGWAIQEEDEPARFAMLGLVVTNPITLLVAASGLSVVPAANMAVEWAGVIYTAKSVEALAPDGTAITYRVIGGRE